MVKKKGKSKRITLKDKYKVQRRVVESHRKTRKQAKRDAKAGIVHHDKKKDPIASVQTTLDVIKIE